MLRIQLLLTGNELMAGDIVDSNSAYFAQACYEHGLWVERKVTLPDDLNALISEIRAQAAQSDVLVINGGLGPTLDDLTAEALAGAMGVTVEEHAQARSHLEDWCARKGFPLSEPNLKQARLPVGIELIHNATGSAPGFMAQLDGCQIYCTPGVPSEFMGMLSETILPDILSRFDHRGQVAIRRLRVFGFGESQVQTLISETFDTWPEAVELGFRASLPMLEVKLKIDQAADESLLEEVEQKLRKHLGAHIVTDQDHSLAAVLVDALSRQNKRVTFAESCTGGGMAAMLTQAAGASQVFDSGFVTYANASKVKQLNVPDSVLETEGAVSEACVRAMLKGALEASGADFGVAVSGIAGPGGGTESKPVGTVCVAWGDLNAMRSADLFLPFPRQSFQTWVSAMGLDLIRRLLIDPGEVPVYIVGRARRR